MATSFEVSDRTKWHALEVAEEVEAITGRRPFPLRPPSLYAADAEEQLEAQLKVVFEDHRRQVGDGAQDERVVSSWRAS